MAARAGVGKTTVYRWWSSKSALAIEAISSRLNSAPIAATNGSRADLRAALVAIIDGFAGSSIGETLAAVVADLLRTPEGTELLEGLLQPQLNSVRTVIEEVARRSGLPADVDVELLQDVVAGTLLYRLLMNCTSSDRVIDQLLDLILDGRMPLGAPQD